MKKRKATKFGGVMKLMGAIICATNAGYCMSRGLREKRQEWLVVSGLWSAIAAIGVALGLKSLLASRSSQAVTSDMVFLDEFETEEEEVTEEDLAEEDLADTLEPARETEEENG